VESTLLDDLLDLAREVSPRVSARRANEGRVAVQERVNVAFHVIAKAKERVRPVVRQISFEQAPDERDSVFP